MAWNGAGNFQRTNGSFSGADVWTDDANAGYDIVDARHDAHDQDLAQGINNCLTKDGQNSPTANLSMNSFKHTNVGDGTARNQYATVGQLQDQGVQTLSLVGGTTTTITASMTPTISSYVTGARYYFKAVNTNSGSTTLKIDSAPAVTIQLNGSALTGGEIVTGRYFSVIYDGTNFQLLNPATSGTVRTVPATVAQVQDNAFIYGGTSTGTANAQAINLTPDVTALVAGQRFIFKAGFSNTGATTLAVDSITPAVAIQRFGAALVGGEIRANDIVEVVYDGTQFQLDNCTPPPLFVDRTNNRVGIGTTAPEGSLDISVTAEGPLNLQRYSADASPQRINFFKSRGSSLGSNTIVQSGDSLASIGFYGANGSTYSLGAEIRVEVDGTPGATNDMPTRVRFATTADGAGSPTERMRIDSAGNVGIGTTGPTSSLCVAGGAQTVPSLAAVHAGTSGSYSLIHLANVNGGYIDFGPTGVDYAGRIIFNNSTNAFQVIAVSNGVQLSSGGTSWAAISDIRFKKNIQPLEYGLECILSLNPIRFDYLEEQTDDSKRIGFSAQNVKDAIPEAVSGDESDRLFLSQTEIIPVLANAIKQLSAKLDALTTRIEALEA